MGFKTCNRAGCDNFSCHKYSSTYGYICDSCFWELLKKCVDPTPINIKAFMNTPKNKDKPKLTFEELKTHYEKEFPEDGTR